MTEAKLLYDLARYTNPWTIEIQNQITGQWMNHYHDAPITLLNAEKLIVQLMEENPAALFRVRPWLNPNQVQMVQDQLHEAKGFAIAAEIKVKELLANGERLKEAMGMLHCACVQFNSEDEAVELCRPDQQTIDLVEERLSETPTQSLEAIRAEAAPYFAEQYEIQLRVAKSWYERCQELEKQCLKLAA